MLSKIALPGAILYTILLTILSLIKVNDLPEFGTNFDDKVYHVLAYLVLTLLWFVALKIKHSRKHILYLAIACMLFGTVIEALQGKLTAYRVSDSLDIIANIVGVLLALIYISLRKRPIS